MVAAQCLGFLNTLPLWEKKQFDIQQFEFPSLMLSRFKPKALPQNIRLGHQMEYVFKQLVEYSEAYDIVLHNLPIRQEKRTLGEIDFILKDRATSKLIHVEMTYKFYIIDTQIAEPMHRLIGPNRRDTFFLKMEKIKNVQFPLLHSLEGAKALSEINIDHEQVEHQCCFKAQLFKPYDSTSNDIGTFSQDGIVGYWLRISNLEKPEFANSQFYIPSKSEWVIAPNDQVTWLSFAEIRNDIMLMLRKERAPMVWLKKKNSEFEKCFVVWW